MRTETFLNLANIEENRMCCFLTNHQKYVCDQSLSYVVKKNWNWVLKIFTQYNKWFIWIIINSLTWFGEKWFMNWNFVILKILNIEDMKFWKIIGVVYKLRPRRVDVQNNKFFFQFLEILLIFLEKWSLTIGHHLWSELEESTRFWDSSWLGVVFALSTSSSVYYT